MSLGTSIYALTALAALAVIVTRLWLGGDGRAVGRTHTSHRLLLTHTIAGVLAVAVWFTFLVSADDTLPGGAVAGIVAIGLWWVTAVVGLMLLARWLPARGKHAQPADPRSWLRGPWPAVFCHLGVFVAVLVFTYAYLTSSV